MCQSRCCWPIPYDYVEYDKVPKAVVQATCEMARELLIVDRTAAPVGEGLKFYNNAGVQNRLRQNR